jgi:hypothetical protein
MIVMNLLMPKAAFKLELFCQTMKEGMKPNTNNDNRQNIIYVIEFCLISFITLMIK